MHNTNHWTKAPPIEGTIVVNIGDLLQFWSADKYKGTSHRVVVDSTNCDKSRYSMAFFVHPNYETPIKPFDESAEKSKKQNAAAMTAKEYIQERFTETYRK